MSEHRLRELEIHALIWSERCYPSRRSRSSRSDPSGGAPGLDVETWRGLHHSTRMAWIGSSREARQAGVRQARTATSKRVKTTAPNTAGSSGLVPYRIDNMKVKTRVAM